MPGALRMAGLGGVVLLLFGLVSYAWTGRFDLWVAVHVASGAVLVAAAVALNLARFRRTVAARATRERARAGAGVAIVAAILVVLNVAASRRPVQWDLTASRIHTLSEKSRAVLRGLSAPVEAFAFVAVGSPERARLEPLFARFAAEGGGLFRWRFVDAESDPQLADALGVRREGAVAVRSGERIVRGADAIDRLGEGELAKLVVQVSRAGARVVYVVSGHGEPAVDDVETASGLGLLAGVLEEESFTVRPLLLPATGAIPGDAALVVLAGPTKALDSREVELLRTFTRDGGRLLVMLEPGAEPGIEALLADWRVVPGDDLVIDQVVTPFEGASLGAAPLVNDFPNHPATRGFRENVVVSIARSVSPADHGGLPGVTARVLARTSPSSWAETAWRDALRDGRVGLDDADRPGPVSIAVAAEGEGGKGRLVAIGDADLATNARVGSYFNREFLVNLAQWLTGAEDLIVEPPRGLRASRLDLSEADTRNLFRFCVLLLPEALLIIGLAVGWRRRTL
jgi:ABC-type uncharacterized transport system involved in gliding motility auxiliary subunit